MDRWVQTEWPRAAWHADLHALADRPHDLASVVLEVLEAGERHDVMRFVEVPALAWRADRDPPLATVIERRWLEGGPAGEHVVDAFGFTRATWTHPGDAVVAARLAVRGADGRVEEREVRDASVFVDPSAPPAARVPRPPLAVFGHRYAFRGSPLRLIGGARGAPGWTLRVMTFTDIWWPVVHGLPHGVRVDNARIAAGHTGRLNAFLADVARCVTAHGGRWSVERRRGPQDPMVTDRGISLDVP